MKKVAALLLVLCLSGCSTARQPEVDTDYVLALSTANEFLEAWRKRDQAAGLSLLSARLRKSRTEPEWRQAISGISNPHHTSYEIGSGQRLPDGRIRFDIHLHYHYTGQRSGGAPRKGPRQIILIEVGNENWKVDEIPEL